MAKKRKSMKIKILSPNINYSNTLFTIETDQVDKKKMTTPYFTTKKEGTGLGLSIVTKIISNHKSHRTSHRVICFWIISNFKL